MTDGDMFTCAYEGCEHGLDSGHVLYNTTPGEAFTPMCSDHYIGEIDPFAQAVQDENQRRFHAGGR